MSSPQIVGGALDGAAIGDLIPVAGYVLIRADEVGDWDVIVDHPLMPCDEFIAILRRVVADVRRRS